MQITEIGCLLIVALHILVPPTIIGACLILKIGNEEKVHVYYARGEEDPNFFRRCYWLLDK